MSNKKRYYWLKLDENFFEEDTIQWLEEQENGKDYIIFYLKLCLKALKDDGRLIRVVGQTLIPYDVKALSKLTNTDVDTVNIAMALFQKIGLVKLEDSGAIYMQQLQEMVGSESSSAIRMRRHRARKSLEEPKPSQCDTINSQSDYIVQESDKDVRTFLSQRDSETSQSDKKTSQCDKTASQSAHNVQKSDTEYRVRDRVKSIDIDIENRHHHLDSIRDEETEEKQKNKNGGGGGSDEITVKEILDFYQNNFGILSPYVSEDLQLWCNDLEPALVKRALEIALERQKNYNYAKSIMERWFKSNITTLEDAEYDAIKFKRQREQKYKVNYRREPVPDWLDKKEQKEDKHEEMSDEEQKELEERVESQLKSLRQGSDD